MGCSFKNKKDFISIWFSFQSLRKSLVMKAMIKPVESKNILGWAGSLNFLQK